MLSAGAAVTFFGHVFGENEVGFGERLIVEGGEAVEACHGLGDALRDGLGYGVGDFLGTGSGVRFRRGVPGGGARASEPNTN